MNATAQTPVVGIIAPNQQVLTALLAAIGAQGSAQEQPAARTRTHRNQGAGKQVVKKRDQGKRRGQHRHFHRARYYSTLHHKAKVEKLPLTAVRFRVLAAIHSAGRRGLSEQELQKLAHVSHGSASSTLDWLRRGPLKLVRAAEDHAASPA